MLIRNTDFHTGKASWRLVEPFWANDFRGVGREERAGLVIGIFIKIILGGYAG